MAMFNNQMVIILIGSEISGMITIKYLVVFPETSFICVS